MSVEEHKKLQRSDADIKDAVILWISNRSEGEEKYGHISSWDTSKVTKMDKLFSGKKDFNDDISGWNTSAVTTMRNMFHDASKFNQDISGWNTAQATSMDGMFREAQLFNQDLSAWCVQNISSLPDNFASASGLSESNYPVWGNCPG